MVIIMIYSVSVLVNYSLFQTSPVCFVDQILVFDGALNESPNVTIARNNVTFTSQLLILDRIYNVSVVARNIAGSRMSHATIRTYAAKLTFKET